MLLEDLEVAGAWFRGARDGVDLEVLRLVDSLESLLIGAESEGTGLSTDSFVSGVSFSLLSS